MADNIAGAFKDAQELYGKEINTVPRPEPQIGIDLSGNISQNIIDAGDSSHIDIGKIDSFTQVSQSRDTMYGMLDTMSEDSTVAAVLETYAEDVTEPNDQGQIMWCESDDAEVGKFITYLLDDINIEKNIYKWAYSLIKYGDVYLRLYHESEFEDDLFSDKKEQEEELQKKKLNEVFQKIDAADISEDQKEKLRENVILKVYNKSDNFVHYLEMIPNPAEMFELTKFGKSYAYIKAPISSNMSKNQDMSLLANTYRYQFRKKDVLIFEPTNFVHAALEDDVPRVPEQVQIFIEDKAQYQESDTNLSYSVKRGQSILYNSFKIWRELMLLENAMLLNRLTKSSLIRIFNVEVGDMPKENVGPHLMGIKNLVEQKSSLDTGSSFSEYTNPGPMENNIYVPTHNQMGTISMQNIGGDVNVTGLDDVDYFQNKFFSCLRGTQKIKFVDGTIEFIEKVFSNIKEFIGKKIYSCNSDGTLEIGHLTNVSITDEDKEFIRFTLEDGSIIDVTPEHRMMLADGTFKCACEICEEDELMSL